jgi:hypothetical protein
VPAFVYETSLDRAQFAGGRDIAVDDAGNAYVVARAYDTNNDVLIVKLDPNGGELWHTYLGGNSHDFGFGIEVNAAGDVYVGGWTLSSDFPVLNAWQSSLNGGADAFITKLLGQDGSLIFSTYYGGARAEYGYDIALDDAGNVYLTGYTDSTDLPTMNPIQPNLNLTWCFCDDAFVAKFDGEGMTLLYGTYLGGAKDDRGYEVDVDGQGNIYFAGTTASPDWPLANALQTVYGGNQDAFVAQISHDGNTLNYSTYLGGYREEFVKDIVVNDSGAYLVGGTNSPDYLTTSGAFQEQYSAGGCGSLPHTYFCYDVFVTKLLPDGTADFSTYIGGVGDDIAGEMALDRDGRIHLVGFTGSADFPLANHAGFYIFVTELSETGSNLSYTLPIESPVANDGHSIAVDGTDAIYITGAQNVPSDLYIAKLSEDTMPVSLLQSTDIALSYRGRNNRYLVQAGVKVEDAQRTAVAGAKDDITWTLPGDKIDQQSE